MRTLSTLLLILAIGACGDDDTQAEVDGGDGDGGEADAGDQALPDAFQGYFHFEQIDATNLRLDEDGTFRWTIYGCDFSGGDEGVWARDGDRILLRAANEASTFTWSHDVTFAFEVEEIELSAGSGILTAVGRNGGSDVFEQTWQTGGACPECGGDLGPTGQCACDDPFVDGACD